MPHGPAGPMDRSPSADGAWPLLRCTASGTFSPCLQAIAFRSISHLLPASFVEFTIPRCLRVTVAPVVAVACLIVFAGVLLVARYSITLGTVGQIPITGAVTVWLNHAVRAALTRRRHRHHPSGQRSTACEACRSCVCPTDSDSSRIRARSVRKCSGTLRERSCRSHLPAL